MQIVPLQSLPNQIVNIILNGQACVLQVYQKFYGLYMDVTVDETLIIGGVVCEDRNRIVRSDYLGFVGDFAFFDVVGNHDPDYTALGSQFVLAYLEPSDLTTLGIK